MISKATIDLILEVFRNPKDTIYDFLLFLRERQGVGRNAWSRMLRNLVLCLPESDACKYRDEIDFLKNVDQDYLEKCVFPYPVERARSTAECGYDDKVHLPYVVHRGMRLFFCRGEHACQVRDFYLYLREVEGILGGGCLGKSPHAYVTEYFCVEKGDVLVDVGCSEALFTLDNIEKVDRAYVFETMKKWDAPLHATFSSFGDKVTIVNKLVGGGN